MLGARLLESRVLELGEVIQVVDRFAIRHCLEIFHPTDAIYENWLTFVPLAVNVPENSYKRNIPFYGGDDVGTANILSGSDSVSIVGINLNSINVAVRTVEPHCRYPVISPLGHNSL